MDLLLFIKNIYWKKGRKTSKINPRITIIMRAEYENMPILPVFQGSAKTILLADDEETVRTFTRTVLETAGYRVIEAVDGEDAVEKFRKYNNDIFFLILDVIMPKKNGRETYDEISKIRPGIRTLFISGYVDDVMSREGMTLQGVSFVSKPFSPAILLKNLSAVFN